MSQLGSRLLLTVAMTFAACGGEDKGRLQAALSSDAGVVDPCQASAGLQFQNIADFEGDDAQCDTVVAPAAGAQCFFLNYDSETSPRSCAIPMATPCLLPDGQQISDDVCLDQNPGRGGRLPDTKLEDAPRCGSSKGALHYVGKNIAICIDPTTKRQGWGATLQVTFNWTASGKASAPYDARAWDGVSFWIRKGTGPTSTALLAAVQDVFTAAPPAPLIDGGSAFPPYCSVVATDSDAKKCDAFGVAVLMTEEWRFVKLPFAQLQQKGFGVPSPTGRLDTGALLGLQFSLAAGDWDLWLDDMAFYREAR